MWATVVIGVLFILLCVGGGAFFLPRLLETSSSEQPVEPMEARSLVGPEGGKVAGLGGAEVIIPEGALVQEASIGITEVPTAQNVPPDTAPAGPAYQVEILEDARLLKALEVVLPLEREPGSNDADYAVYHWDGVQWQFLGGMVEGNSIHVQVGHHVLSRAPVSGAKAPGLLAFANRTQDNPTFLRAFRELSTGRYRTIAFVNQGQFQPWIHAWTYEAEKWTGTIRILPSYGGWSGGKPGDFYYPYTWAWMRLPFGTYTSWCIEWWDRDEKDHFHFMLDSPVTLDLSTCTRDEQDRGACEIPRVDYSLPPAGSGEQGLCGRPPGRDEALPAPTPIPTSTSGPSTPAPPTPIPTAVPPTPTSTSIPPTPTSTPPPAPTATPTSSPGGEDIRIYLFWHDQVDFDLVVYDPSGDAVFDENTSVPSGGRMDQMVHDCNEATTSSTESAYWPAGSAPSGEYRAVVLYMHDCLRNVPVKFRLTVQVDGYVVLDEEGSLTPTDGTVYLFTR